MILTFFYQSQVYLNTRDLHLGFLCLLPATYVSPLVGGRCENKLALYEAWIREDQDPLSALSSLTETSCIVDLRANSQTRRQWCKPRN